MNNIDQLQFEINFIKNNDIKTVVTRVLSETTPSYFWEVDSSSTGKYHPKMADGTPITLIGHTKSATRALRLLLTHPMIASNFDANSIDLMTGAIILHDVAKKGLTESKYTVHEHPLLVKELRPSNMTQLQNIYFDNMISYIEPHTGPWRRNNYSEVVLPIPENYGQYIVHMADWLASRIILHINIDDEPSVFNYLKDINF